ncbi:hypothetical protein HPB50_008191 [Hyalomma asiaticum]|uniref:Uncharacterized protein n=1 Tax=Hyalomma asiaticum TaxID=266040 RepID=A0ACB7SEW7_HYAAI|nr:hypothetical protein HPB50_008191 [Hyalomma asiaticum]
MMESSLWRRYLLLDLETSDYFDCADVIGDGPFQRKIMLLSVLSVAILQSHNLAFALISSPVDHWCRPPEHLANISEDVWKNIGIPLDPNGQPSSCRMYASLNGTSEVISCDSWFYSKDRADSTVVGRWNLVCHQAWLLHAAKVAHVFGASVATATAGYMADHAGRLPVIDAATTLLLLSALVLAFVESYEIYVTMRFVLCGAASALVAVTNLLLYEVSPTDRRTRRLGTAVLLAFVPCMLLFLTLRETQLNWLQLQTAMGSPTALAPLFFVLAVESPRWLVATKQFDRAGVVFTAAVKENGFGKTADAVAAAKRLKSMASAKVDSLKVTLLSVLGIRLVRHRATTVFASSFAVTFAYYALTPTAGLIRAWGGAASLVASIAVFVICLLVFNYVSRIVMVSVNLSALACCSCLASLMLRIKKQTVGRVFVVFARAFSVTGMMVNYIYVLELFPTPIRGVFFCAAYACGHLGATIAALLEGFYDVVQEDSLLGFVVFVVFNVVLLLLRMKDTDSETPAEPTTMQTVARNVSAATKQASIGNNTAAVQPHDRDKLEAFGAGELPAGKEQAFSLDLSRTDFRTQTGQQTSGGNELPTVTAIAGTTSFH